MLQPRASSEVLAHWRYAPDDWRHFVSYEAKNYEKSIKSAKYFIVIVLAITLIVVTLLLGVPLWLGYPWREDVWGPAFGGTLLAGLFLAVGVLVWAWQRSKLSSLSERAGDVLITLDGIKTNDIWFGWKRGELGWRLRHIARKTISVGPARSMEVLEFKCAAQGGVRTTRRVVDAWRIPIPPGKETEADRIIERLFAAINFLPSDERNSQAQPLLVQHDSEKNFLGHEFAGDVCRKCGSTVEAVTNFKWACKR